MHFPWIIAALKNDKALMLPYGVHAEAQAKRCTIFHIVTKALGTDAVSTFMKNDEDEFKARKSRLQAYKYACSK